MMFRVWLMWNTHYTKHMFKSHVSLIIKIRFWSSKYIKLTEDNALLNKPHICHLTHLTITNSNGKNRHL